MLILLTPRIVSWAETDVSEEHSASVFKTEVIYLAFVPLFCLIRKEELNIASFDIAADHCMGNIYTKM
jgi:hypothetical protein